MRRYRSVWSRLTNVGHLVGGGAALIATAVAWRQLSLTATHLNAAANTHVSDAATAFPPHIMVVVPARNEATTIARCLTSLVAQRLAPAGIWVVDDGSADATAATVEALAVHDARIYLIAGTPKPADWAGKNWALHQGIRAALSARPTCFNQWLLLTDADTWHQPDLLLRAYDHAITAALQIVSVAPRVAERDWGAVALRGAVGEYYSFYYGLDLPTQTTDAQATMAQGQFMLVQRAWYQAVGGFAHPTVRAALDDDRALANRVKHAGGRVGMLSQPDLLATTGYLSLGAAWDGHLHHIAPTLTGSRQLWHAMWALLLVDVATLLPAVGMLHALQLGVTRGWRQRRMALIRWGVQLGAITLVRYRAAQMASLPRWYPLLAPLGGLLLQGLVAQALWRRITGMGHIVWKGRRYP